MSLTHSRLSYFTKVFWAWEREQEKRRRIHINTITIHHPCFFRWFFSWWRARSNGHINYKLSINVNDVGLTLDCRITHFYGSCGLLCKHNRDGRRPRLNAPSAPTLGGDVQTKSVDTRRSPGPRFLFYSALKRGVGGRLMYVSYWGWFALQESFTEEWLCYILHGISSKLLFLNKNVKDLKSKRSTHWHLQW